VIGAAIANSAWFATSSGAAIAFDRALSEPRGAQERWLRRQLERHASSEYGRAHSFAAIRSTADFARLVPLATYDSLEPHIRRIATGRQDILACGRVTHLAPTSGSTGAVKLIPFTASLQEGFAGAVSAWMVDLVRQRPALIGGRSYWSVSPAVTSRESRVTSHDVTVGFADDAEYVGGAAAWLVRRVIAVPSHIRLVRDVTAFWRLTLLQLLRARDLRLISIWHPSFIELLVAEAEPAWPELLHAVETGSCPWEAHLPAGVRLAWRAPPAGARANELKGIGPREWPKWWPHLQVLSCWGEQAAEAGWRRLVATLPDVLVQPKGLLATEAVVTIPWRGQTPLAVTSHYFEFIDERGEVRRAHELERGSCYEVVVTNGGGLWRYQLGDVVECTGRVAATPSLRFLGRAGRVTDMRGEKVSETFVATVLRDLWHVDHQPAYAALRARDRGGVAGYELLVSSDWNASPLTELAARAESALGENPHYAIARRLGQLTALRVVLVDPATARERLRATPGRLGDTKPSILLDQAE
jgi:hypothetical protein